MNRQNLTAHAGAISEQIRRLTELSGEIDALISTLRAGEAALAKDYADLANTAEARIRTIQEALAGISGGEVPK